MPHFECGPLEPTVVNAAVGANWIFVCFKNDKKIYLKYILIYEKYIYKIWVWACGCGCKRTFMYIESVLYLSLKKQNEQNEKSKNDHSLN